MIRRCFNLLAGASLLIFVALLLDNAFRPQRPPPPPTITGTMTQVNGVWQFNYHATAVSTVRVYHIFGHRVPFGLALLLTALFPLCWGFLWLIAALATATPAPGHCLVCGYDLRATPDRCPECGTECETVPKKK